MEKKQLPTYEETQKSKAIVEKMFAGHYKNWWAQYTKDWATQERRAK